MPKIVTIPVPGQIRRHVLKNVKPKTQGEGDLLDACREGAEELEAKGMNSLNTIDLHLTNDAVGSALDIARGWLDSDNGNNVMAGKSMLKYELEYEPDDPREIRHAVKMPKSLSGHFSGQYGFDSKQHARESKTVRSDLGNMSWTANGASGRVRAETLGWFLGKMDRLKENAHPATARAAKKFIATYTEPYQQTQRLINGYLVVDEGEDQAPDFMEAIHGRDEAEQPKRLVVIACGGKKSERPGRIPADERYTGNYFTACRLASDVMDGATMVLSAKYGLIPLSEEIENYDVKIGDKGSVRLGRVREQAKKLGLEGAKVTVLGGERYVRAARQIWPDAEAPLKGGIGQQLQQLAGIYGGEALKDDEDLGQEPDQERPERVYQTKLQEIGYLPHRNTPKPRLIWFGGKAGRFNPEPGRWTRAEVVYTGEGRYVINQLATGDELLSCSLRSLLHWGPLDSPDPGQKPAPAPVENGDQERREPEVKSVAAAQTYEVPENWLELAEEGNTPQARAYWTRRCEEYRRTGR
ncbi:hypothetical protein OHB13_11925 [Streptomyces sp. NBC_00440]|uniref:DUF6884 domain-containing protein n=1 Tax=Streptomyces sp. NBC_00440 TaxID=2975741 RepID=UPI002E21656B|nr:DUF6884 domain-containing protein [Streptomyces sp. NBC_00440]